MEIENQVPYFEIIPIEIVYHILSDIEDFETIFNSVKVCKEWNKLIFQSCYWKKFYSRRYIPDILMFKLDCENWFEFNKRMEIERKKSIEEYEREKFNGLDKIEWIALNNKGLEASKMRNLHDSIEYYTLSLSKQLNGHYSAKLYSNIAVVYVKMACIHPKYMSEAKKYFDLSLKTDPYDSTTYSNIGVYYAKQNDTTSAISSFEKAIKLDPNNINAICHKAECFFRLGRYNEAETLIDQVLELKENYHCSLRLKSLISSALNKNSEADLFMKKAKTLALKGPYQMLFIHCF